MRRLHQSFVILFSFALLFFIAGSSAQDLHHQQSTSVVAVLASNGGPAANASFTLSTPPDTDHAKEGLDSSKYTVEYAIQVGAFSSKKNAEKLMKKMKKAGYSVDIYDNLIDGKKMLYLVWIGTYKNETDAEPDRLAIHTKFKIDGVVRPRTAWPHR